MQTCIMAQLMPLPPTVSCFSKIQIGFTVTFLVLAHLGSPGQRAVKRVGVCVYQEQCEMVHTNGARKLARWLQAQRSAYSASSSATNC